MSLAMQHRLIREDNVPSPDTAYDGHTLDGSHMMWLVRPRAAAAILGSLADQAA